MRGRTISKLFSKSPFGPTQMHLKKALECAMELRPLFEAALASDTERQEAVTERIDELEHETDLLKNEIRDTLPRSLFLPVDRRDLLELIHMQDSIADSTQEVAGLLALKQLQLPDDLKPLVMELIEEILVTCDMASAIGSEMDELAETSFGGPEAERVLAMINQLDDYETKSDVIGVQLSKALFAHEDEMKATDVMLWYNIFFTAGQVANYAERMGNRLRLLIAHV